MSHVVSDSRSTCLLGGCGAEATSDYNGDSLGNAYGLMSNPESLDSRTFSVLRVDAEGSVVAEVGASDRARSSSVAPATSCAGASATRCSRAS